MSFINDIIDGVANDVISAVADRWTTSTACGTIEACCQQLGWTIHSRTKDGRMGLRFDDPLVGTRTVMVSIMDRGAFVSFMVISGVTMPVNDVPPQIMGYMLERNVQPFVLWQVAVGDDGQALFTLNYRVPTPGLQPHVFKLLVQKMTSEALAFDSRMHKAGLLRSV
jgi:hypothetical protein